MILFNKRIKKLRFRFSRQLESLDCAPACLKMISEFHGQRVSLDYLRDVCITNKLGTSIFSLTNGANQIGFETVTAQINLSSLTEKLPFPSVLFWNKSHFVVLIKVIPESSNSIFKFFNSKGRYVIADPGFGILKLTEDDFARKWLNDESKEGVIIFFEPNQFFQSSKVQEKNSNSSRLYLNSLIKLVSKYKSGLVFILVGMIISSIISLAFPILTQRIVDIGIKYKSRDFIFLILLFQLGLFISMIFIDTIKSWMLLHIGTKIEINLTYDFLSKLMRLPLFFFDMKVAGDLMQRISDNGRIQNFIKTQLLDFIISIANFVTLTFLILRYDNRIFLIFLAGSIFGILWAFYFIRKREILDYRRFDVNTENTDNLIETIVAMPEVRLNSAEEFKKNKWQRIQIKLFDVNTRILLLQQFQNSGSTAINQLKNITVTFFAAQQVIFGNLSLGEMVGLSFIVGQLNLPLYQMVGFIQFFQEARISFKRLAEIQSKNDEDFRFKDKKIDISNLLDNFDEIRINNLDFSYSYSRDDLLFNDLCLRMPRGRVTAIVGSSGSGKTTLMKLILKFYEPLRGEISIGNVNLSDIPSLTWRNHCGVVQQEGHVFTDTVENNIAMATENIDRQRLEEAARISCIHSFISSLPMGYSTKVGNGGMGLSTGQKQRILIARAIYKNPDILFFDEATSSLDSNNEKDIHENLILFLKNKTVVIIAHRLSTVKNADNIIVLESGKIIEQGNHENLIAKKGMYLSLIKNQLELG
jgi:ATP-binding cassette, subfamily B, bacterial